MKLLLFAPIVLAALLSNGAEEPASVPTPKAPLNLDPVHSSTIFRIKHAGCAWFYGRFNNTSGTIDLDLENPESGSIEITIQVDDVNTGAAQRDAHLKRADFFDAPQFPTISFKSTGITKGNTENMFEVTGDLTMRGNTKSITIPLEYTGQGQFRGSTRHGFASTFTINRSDWEVSYGLGTMLADEVQLTFGLEAAPPRRR